MFKNIATTVAFLLLAGTASATFELDDPASEILENTPEKIAEYLGNRSCYEFLLTSAKDTKAYQADLVRIRDYVLGSGVDARLLPDEDRIRSFCIDNPKTSLRATVDTLVLERP